MCQAWLELAGGQIGVQVLGVVFWGYEVYGITEVMGVCGVYQVILPLITRSHPWVLFPYEELQPEAYTAAGREPLPGQTDVRWFAKKSCMVIVGLAGAQACHSNPAPGVKWARAAAVFTGTFSEQQQLGQGIDLGELLY